MQVPARRWPDQVLPTTKAPASAHLNDLRYVRAGGFRLPRHRSIYITGSGPASWGIVRTRPAPGGENARTAGEAFRSSAGGRRGVTDSLIGRADVPMVRDRE